MKILSRYLARTVANSTLTTLLVLLALQCVFSLVEEVGDLGQGDYTFVKAVYVIGLTIPHVIYEMLPMALLMGTLLGLGQLATSSELVAMRAAGVSIWRIAAAVMQLGFLMLIVTFAMGELVVPQADRHAMNVKQTAISGGVAIDGATGVWLRSQPYYLRIDDILGDGYVRGVEIFSLDKQQRLTSIVEADEAIIDGQSWSLKNARLTRFVGRSAQVERSDTLLMQLDIDMSLLSQSTLEPEQLSLLTLPSYIDYFKQNGLESGKYELAFWLKIVAPLSNLVMILLAVPFAFGSLRSAGNGQRMVVGVFIGLGYALLGRLVNHVGLAYGFAPLLCALAPLMLFLAYALHNLRRVR